MPRHDPPRRRPRRRIEWIGLGPDGAALDRMNRRKRRRDKDDGGVPVEPDKPLGLSGGAAAALDFENE